MMKTLHTNKKVLGLLLVFSLLAFQVEGSNRMESEKEGWGDNLAFMIALDGSKQPQDLGVNAHIGAFGSANWGIPLIRSFNLGVQVGVSFIQSFNGFRILEAIEGTSSKTQLFSTLGLFQRTTFGLNWGLAFDHLYEDYFDTINVNQLRAEVSYRIHPNYEIGVWFTQRTNSDEVTFLTTNLLVETINQYNLFVNYISNEGAQFALSVGLADRHGTVLITAPQGRVENTQPALGIRVHLPLNRYIAMFGRGQFITPVDTGTIDAFMGIRVHLDGQSKKQASRNFSPVQPEAYNPNFAVDLRLR